MNAKNTINFRNNSVDFWFNKIIEFIHKNDFKSYTFNIYFFDERCILEEIELLNMQNKVN